MHMIEVSDKILEAPEEWKEDTDERANLRDNV